ncbi:MAG: hypothetical protein WCI72_00235 [archaeon]
MKYTESKNFEQTNPLVYALNYLVNHTSEATKIPTNVHGQMQYLVRDSLIVLTYQPTAGPLEQVLHEWRALSDRDLAESRALVQDAMNVSDIPMTEEINCD